MAPAEAWIASSEASRPLFAGGADEVGDQHLPDVVFGGDRLRPGAVDVDAAQRGEGGLGGEEAAELLEADPQRDPPVRRPPDCRDHRRQHLGAARFERRPQRLGLAVEVFVEGRLGDRGGGGDVGDRRRRVALRRDRDGEAADDPLFGAVGGEGRGGGDRLGDDQPAGAAQRARRRREAHRPFPEALDEVGQLRLAPLQEAPVDHLVEAAGDPAQQLARHRRAARHPLGGVADQEDDPVDRPLHRLDPGGARGVGLDQAHARRRGLLDDQPDEGLERQPGTVLDVALAAQLVGDRGDPGRHHLLLGGAEAVELVVELFVEGGAGDAGGAQQVLDRGGVVALLVAAGDERGEQTLALVPPSRLTVATATGRESALPQRIRVSPRRLQHPPRR